VVYLSIRNSTQCHSHLTVTNVQYADCADVWQRNMVPGNNQVNQPGSEALTVGRRTWNVVLK